uniref:Protein YIPF n=1 Tax=Echinococcus granulosus TaxID=6210 RepID=A0A068WE46_ECHGR|nr:protein YIPF5 YIP1 family [Echinococcus granulosus]
MSSQQYYYSQSQSYNPGYFEPNNVHFSQFSYGDATQQKAQNPYFTPASVDGNINVQFNFEDEPPLLEGTNSLFLCVLLHRYKLGVNFGHILQKTLNVLNPMRECPQEVLDDTDLAGPLVFCLIFGGTLLLAGKVHFNYIYGIGLLGCLSMYTLLSLMAPQGVAPTCVVSVLGYCMLPMCVLSTVGIVFSLKSPLGVVLTAFIVFWSAMSSSKLFVRALSLEKQRFLVGYPCALVYAVFALLTVF